MAASSNFTLYPFDGLPAGPLVQTKPIPGRRDTPPFHYSINPPFQFPAPLGGTRPGGRSGGVHRAKQSQFFDCGLWIVRNKANSRHGVRRGKGFAGKELW
jgi:hypothetical protein